MIRVRLLVCAVDGVVTDGAVLYGVSGGDSRVLRAVDARGAALLAAGGVALALVHPRPSHSVSAIARDLGASLHVDPDRGAAFASALAAAGIDAASTAAMGCDVDDLPMMARAGLSIAPSSAEPSVLAAASIATGRPGGGGALRDAAERILAGRLG